MPYVSVYNISQQKKTALYLGFYVCAECLNVCNWWCFTPYMMAQFPQTTKIKTTLYLKKICTIFHINIFMK